MMEPHCIACGTRAEFRPVFAGLDRCDSCGFVTYRGLVPDALYDTQYFRGGEYPDYVGQERALRRSMRRHLSQMSHHGGLGGALLEVGCAYGFFLDEAKKSFARVAGVDVAPEAIEEAKRRFELDVRCGDFVTAELDGPFDVVCLWDTVEHLARPDAYLSRARELMRPGARLFLTTGDIGSLNARIRGARWRQIHPPTHLHYFSRATVRRLLERTGFEVTAIETTSYYHTLFNVLGSMALRRGALGSIAAAAGGLIGEELGSRVGLWIDLFDIMFVAAKAS